MTRYQSTKVKVVNAARPAKGTSQFAQWVRDNYNDKYFVAVDPYDVDGQFAHEPLKNRGYEFAGAGADHVERGLLVGRKAWFKAFETEAEAEAEAEVLTDNGI